MNSQTTSQNLPQLAFALNNRSWFL